MKNHIYKAAMLAVLGLALSPVAKAADLYVGFNDLAGNAGNDYVIDLGAFNDFTTTTTVQGTINATLFNQAFGTDANALNDVAVGAVAGGETTGHYYLWSTGNPEDGKPTTQWNDALTAASNIPTGVYASAGSATSVTWDFAVAQSPTLDDTEGTGVASEIGNPESYLANGDVTLTLWQSTLATGIGKTPTAFTELGTLTIDANSSPSDPNADTITFTGADVTAAPEPGTYGLFAVGGLLVHALRRRYFGRVA